MRTGRTLTVFRKLDEPPSPRKFGGDTPPQNLEQTPPPKFGADTPPPKFGADTPPRKFGADTPPPVNRMTDRCKNITLAKTSFRPVKMTNIEEIFHLHSVGIHYN